MLFRFDSCSLIVSLENSITSGNETKISYILQGTIAKCLDDIGIWNLGDFRCFIPKCIMSTIMNVCKNDSLVNGMDNYEISIQQIHEVKPRNVGALEFGWD